MCLYLCNLESEIIEINENGKRQVNETLEEVVPAKKFVLPGKIMGATRRLDDISARKMPVIHA